MPRTEIHLTKSGQRLYHIARNRTGEEETIDSFYQQYVNRPATYLGECWSCESRRKLVGGSGFCTACIRGVIEP